MEQRNIKLEYNNGKRVFSFENLTSEDVSDFTFEDCNFVQCNFERANLSNVTFKTCTFGRATFYNTMMCYVEFISCDLSSTGFYNTNCKNGQFKLTDMSYIHLEGCDLTYTRFSNCVISSASFSRDILYCARFDSCDFYDSTFLNCTVKDIEFKATQIPIGSHLIIGELFRQCARGNQLKEVTLAGLIQIKPAWCWNDFLAYIAKDKELVSFAYRVLSEHICFDDKIKSCLAKLVYRYGYTEEDVNMLTKESSNG